jgi:uncharacterized membrane protein
MMNNFPEAVVKIANDYLARVKAQLGQVPVREQNEFLLEIQSHIYEAYQQTPGDDEIARILTVLRNFGEPADVVADRLPGAMVRAGAKRNLPLYIVGGVFIALFGLPLGFGGIGVLIGLLCAVTGVLLAYFTAAGAVLMAGAVVSLCGLTRMSSPGLWDRLVSNGIIHMDGPFGEFMDQLPTSAQGFLMIVVGLVLISVAIGMLWVGKHLIRGLRFLLAFAFDRAKRVGQMIRQKMSRDGRGPIPAPKPSFG